MEGVLQKIRDMYPREMVFLHCRARRSGGCSVAYGFPIRIRWQRVLTQRSIVKSSLQELEYPERG